MATLRKTRCWEDGGVHTALPSWWSASLRFVSPAALTSACACGAGGRLNPWISGDSIHISPKPSLKHANPTACVVFPWGSGVSGPLGNLPGGCLWWALPPPLALWDPQEPAQPHNGGFLTSGWQMRDGSVAWGGGVTGHGWGWLWGTGWGGGTRLGMAVRGQRLGGGRTTTWPRLSVQSCPLRRGSGGSAQARCPQAGATASARLPVRRREAAAAAWRPAWRRPVWILTGCGRGLRDAAGLVGTYPVPISSLSITPSARGCTAPCRFGGWMWGGGGCGAGPSRWAPAALHPVPLQDLSPLEFALKDSRVLLVVAGVSISPPAVPVGTVCQERRVFPAECRGLRSTYRGRITVSGRLPTRGGRGTGPPRPPRVSSPPRRSRGEQRQLWVLHAFLRALVQDPFPISPAWGWGGWFPGALSRVESQVLEK